MQIRTTTSELVNSETWSDVEVAPTDDGTNKAVIINPPAGSRFYRLIKP